MKIILKETQYVKLKSENIFLTENVDLSGYDSSDFMEVFFMYFRNWVKQKHGDEVGMYPASILIRKYLEDFGTDMGFKPYNYGTTERKVIDAGKELVKLGKHQLTSLRSNRKFIDQHKRALDTFFKTIKIPSFVKLEFKEETPYDLTLVTKVDLQSMIKNFDYENPPSEVDKPRRKLREFISNVMGIEYGNPVAGQLSLSDYVRRDENPELDKELRRVKKEIKKGHENDVRAFKVEYNDSSITIKVLFGKYTRWNRKSDIMESMRKKIEEMGYNTKVLKLDSN